MDATSKQLRLKWDFYLVWLVLAVVGVIFRKVIAADMPWYCVAATVIMYSLFVTLIFYGPVVMVRHAVKVGPQGRALLGWASLIFAVALLACGGLLYLDCNQRLVRLVGLVFAVLLIRLLKKLARCEQS